VINKKVAEIDTSEYRRANCAICKTEQIFFRFGDNVRRQQIFPLFKVEIITFAFSFSFMQDLQNIHGYTGQSDILEEIIDRHMTFTVTRSPNLLNTWHFCRYVSVVFSLNIICHYCFCYWS